MPLVADASSPATTTTASQANASGAFVPPTDSLFAVLWSANTVGGTGPPAPSIGASPSQSFVRDAWDFRDSGSPVVDGQVAFWYALAGGSPGSTVVTVTAGNATACHSALKVIVYTGHDPTAPVGVFGASRQDSGSTISQGYIASITGSQGLMVISDWNAGDMTGVVPAAGCVIVEAGTISGQVSYVILEREYPDGVLGTTTTLGVSGLPTGGRYHWAYAEMVSAEAAELYRIDEWTFGQVLQVG